MNLCSAKVQQGFPAPSTVQNWVFCVLGDSPRVASKNRRPLRCASKIIQVAKWVMAMLGYDTHIFMYIYIYIYCIYYIYIHT